MNANAYPFTTRRQILEKIQADPAFAAECVLILQERHERRGVGGSTESMGFMASHMSMATKLAARLASGEATDKDRVEAAKLAGRYSKQLALVFRKRELAARPELMAQAAVFGVGSGGEARPAPAPTPGTKEEQPGEQPTPTPKRRGRPPGSKNRKTKESPALRRRRRA